MKARKILSVILAVVMIMGTMACVSVSAASEMPEAVGGKITLTSNVELTDTYTVPAGTTLTIDLAGYTISQTKTQTAGYQMILNDGNLTIKDSSKNRSGKISYTDNGNGGEYISDTICNRGVLVIESGTIENLSTETVAQNGYPHAVDTHSGMRDTSVTVNGGTIYCAEYSAIRMFCTSETYKADLVINNGTIIGAVDIQNASKDKACLGSLTVNGGIFDSNKSSNNIRIADWSYYGRTANISGISANIKSGSFDKGIYNNIAPVSEFVSGGIFGEDVTEEFLADGAAVVCGDKKYVKKDGKVSTVAPTEVDTYEELLDALEEDKAQVVMTKDITANATQSSGYGKAGIVLDAGDFLDGNGYTLTINDANTKWDCAIAMRGGKVQNLTIAGAMRGVFMPGANGNVVIDNCVFKDVVYTFNSDAGNKCFSVTITNSKLFGWTSFSNAHKSVVFDTCEFGEGRGYSYCRPYQPTTFTGCEFNEGYEFDTTQVNDNAHAFNNCTYAGEALSADNSSMFYDGGSVLINGNATDVTQYAAKIGETKYSTLKAAVDATQTGDTITVLSDIALTEGVTVPANKTLTIDLNGKTVSMSVAATAESALITNNGTLTIKDSGENGKLTYVSSTVSTGYSTSTIINRGILTVESGIIENTSARGGAPYAIDSYNTLTVNGGTVTATYTTAIRQAQAGNNNTATVNGGTISGGYAGMQVHILNAANKTTTIIKGGTFEGEFAFYTTFYNIVDSSNTEIKVSGGTFDGDVYLYNGNKDSYGLDNVSITGGTFNGETYVYTKDADGNQVPVKAISGGTFKSDVSNYLADGFEIKDNGDGTYGIVTTNIWSTATDAGFYTVEDTPYGMMRFLFAVDIYDEIKETGIKYIKTENIEEEVDTATGVCGTESAFYGDVTGIPEGTQGNYLAVAYVTTASGTYWSDVAVCSPDFTKHFTQYTAQ